MTIFHKIMATGHFLFFPSKAQNYCFNCHTIVTNKKKLAHLGFDQP